MIFTMDIIWDNDIYSDAVMILLQDDDSSDDKTWEEEADIAEQEEPMVLHELARRGGSCIGRGPNIKRHRVLYSHQNCTMISRGGSCLCTMKSTSSASGCQLMFLTTLLRPL
jgi:hypothetical protein